MFCLVSTGGAWWTLQLTGFDLTYIADILISETRGPEKHITAKSSTVSNETPQIYEYTETSW